jgi:glycosyltransferase involved in cell wall biosynthesis
MSTCNFRTPFVEGIEFIGGHPSGRTAKNQEPTTNNLPQGMLPIHGGPEHWAELHLQRRPTLEWFNDWVARIPNFGCGCVNKFAPILARFLPKIEALLGNPAEVAKTSDSAGTKNEAPRTKNQEWFALTVDIHNAVNHELQREPMTQAAAQARWASPFQWQRVTGPRVGFIAIDYMRIGGTETFAQTLLPRLTNVIGFASQNPLYGDPLALGVPAYQGREAIRDLCNESDTIVSWLVNPRDYGYTGRVIMIHHGSPTDEGQTAACLSACLAAGDAIVCVSRSTADHLRTVTPKSVHYIPNAVDPARLVAQASSLWTSQLKSPKAASQPGKLCIWAHRFAPDKRPELAASIADHLPPDWHMIMAGYNGGINLTKTDRITILPPQHPGDLLAIADCFLSTSKFDGFGLSMAEAIAAGVPLVSSPVGIATEPGLATLVDHDAPPSEWAAAIVTAAGRVTRPSLPAENGLTTHVDKWHRLLACG